MVREYYVNVTPTLFQNQQMKIEVTVMWFLSRQLVITNETKTYSLKGSTNNTISTI